MWGHAHAPCAFCSGTQPFRGPNGAIVGPTAAGDYFHRTCALWSCEVWQPDAERLWLLKGVEQAVRRGKQVR